MAHLLTKAKSVESLPRKQSKSSDATPNDQTPSDQQPRESKSSKYLTAAYETILATKGSFMNRPSWKITAKSKALCQSLLDNTQTVPKDTLFRDDMFDETCNSVQGRNEAMVVRHISPLICPSPLVLRMYGAKGLGFLTESVNEGWNSAIPIIYSRPQPDLSVGFDRSAFTDQQLQRLKPLVGEIADLYTSYFLGTWRMYFPFLTCEVKCGTAALDVADRQNAHSMTIAVRAVVELFRYVKREKVLDREFLAFSISHDHTSVRIYGHYAAIDKDKTTFWRHRIRAFDFTEQDGKDKWTAYKFTKNVYESWMPLHLRRICSAIDALPLDIRFDLSQAATSSQSGHQTPQQANADGMSEGTNTLSSIVGLQLETPPTSSTRTTELVARKTRSQSALGK